MVFGDPALVVDLCATGDGRAVAAHDADLVGRVDPFAAARRLFGALAALALAALLREQRGDPGRVDEVGGAGEACKEEEVEEDAATGTLQLACDREPK